MEKLILNIPQINLVTVIFYSRLKFDSLQDLLTFYFNALIPKDDDSTHINCI